MVFGHNFLGMFNKIAAKRSTNDLWWYLWWLLPLACADRTLFTVAMLFSSSGRTMAIVFSARWRVRQRTQAIIINVRQGINFSGGNTPPKRLRRFVFATVYTKSTAGLLRTNCFCEHVLSVCPNARLIKISTIGHYAQHDPILHSLPWTPYGRRQMSHGRICLWCKRPYCRSTKHKPQPTTGNLSVPHANSKSTFVSPFLRFPDTDVGSPKERSVGRQPFLPCEASQWRTKQSLIRSVIH